MALLVIGPSGVGKSTAIAFASRSLDECRFVQLDRITRDLGRERGLIGATEGINALRQRLRNDEAFLRIGQHAVEQLDHQDGGLLVVDVGAGFLDASSVREWLRESTSVALLAPCEVVHGRIVRGRTDPRSLTEYAAQEYTEQRRSLYAQATYSVNADCPEDELGSRFVRLLVGVASIPG